MACCVQNVGPPVFFAPGAHDSSHSRNAMFSHPDALLALCGAGLMVGLVGSTHCVGMCGPFAATAARHAGWRGVVSYSGGRVVTYAVLGLVAGTLGAALAALRYVGFALSAVILVAVALQLAGVLPEPKWAAGISRRLMRLSGQVGPHAARVVLGLSTALLPCGLVYAALGVAISAGSPVGGAAVMVAFGLGTSPLLVAVGAGFGRLTKLGPGVRQVMAVLVAVVGLWALWQRLPDPNGEKMDCCHGVEETTDRSENNAVGDGRDSSPIAHSQE